MHTLTALLALAAGAVLTGCGAGPGNETVRESATSQVAGGDIGAIAVRGARLVTTELIPVSPSATPGAKAGGASDAEGYLMVSLVNRGRSSDTLTNATISGGALQPGSGATSLTIAPRQTLDFGAPSVGASGPTLDVIGLSQPLQPGTSMKVSLTFQDNGTISLDVPVSDASAVGGTETAAPVVLTGSYPTPSVAPLPAPGEPTPTTEPTNEPAG